nr:mitochondrial distribution and morphology protein 12-like [Aegilops tauschii subsp. strangulata]
MVDIHRLHLLAAPSYLRHRPPSSRALDASTTALDPLSSHAPSTTKLRPSAPLPPAAIPPEKTSSPARSMPRHPLATAARPSRPLPPEATAERQIRREHVHHAHRAHHATARADPHLRRALATRTGPPQPCAHHCTRSGHEGPDPPPRAGGEDLPTTGAARRTNPALAPAQTSHGCAHTLKKTKPRRRRRCHTAFDRRRTLVAARGRTARERLLAAASFAARVARAERRVAERGIMF